MPSPTKLDKLEILSRNQQFMRDLEYVQKFSDPSGNRLPFLVEDLPKTELKRRGRFLEEVREPTKKERIRAQIKATGVSPNTLLPEDLKKVIEKLKREKRGDATLTSGVSVIPYKTVPGKVGEPDVILFLRDNRFLTLEIDLLATNPGSLSEEAGESIAHFRSSISKKGRTRKHHRSTSDIDPWAVYDVCHGQSQSTLYKFAKEVYRERTGNVAGFTSECKEYKAARRALKIAENLVNSLPYPPR